MMDESFTEVNGEPGWTVDIDSGDEVREAKARLLRLAGSALAITSLILVLAAPALLILLWGAAL